MASVDWHGHQKEVLISQAEGTPLIGMSLLEGCRLTIDGVENGDVTIRKLLYGPVKEPWRGVFSLLDSGGN